MTPAEHRKQDIAKAVAGTARPRLFSACLRVRGEAQC
jgi:hypothetical protein